ncbi:hypothetical protein AWH56_002910 [Anaerobacillus isosaccharinicus]|uniref:Uncharacterized protein n=1 Tax=Anaerobacillus isosaccharinicus TaxID=1532552 RepID=A0A1S2ME45_9BACI|nr:hypothetical protein [Anaerobacillus isosaccharinicus]MBA5585007.1 hypothetical protein [Anaerobacillus isosaccharinicus]QOY36640.1 hypothetical protein AWH56_002910 [Anaerobacillus isosaccharinicus]
MKEYKYGNTTVIIHSPLTEMTKQEQKEWYRQEWEKKNPVLRSIVDEVLDCQLKKIKEQTI